MDWKTLTAKAEEVFAERDLSSIYRERLDAELYEIVKQGANQIWVDWFVSGAKWETNPNGLILPWLLGMTPIDPIASKIEHIWNYQTDFPDIDLDFLPFARATVKEHATKKYVHVCNVGSWLTYKPKLALQDVTRALGGNIAIVMSMTSALPDEFDDLTLEDHAKFFQDLTSPDPKVVADARQEIAHYQPFYDFKAANPQIVDYAYRLLGKIKSQGTHAGGIIIADRPVDSIVPMSYMGSKDNKVWTSQWTEGKKTQLSKFGLVKFDILGVKTIYYIWQAGNLIKQQRGITIDWSTMDPAAEYPFMGKQILPSGEEVLIHMNDEESLKQCNEQKTDSVFQIETPIQKRIISDGGVRNFWDLVAYNALGRPGPMDCIPEYIRNRDINTNWRDKEDPRIAEILDQTHGVIVYQEQLQAMWTRLAGFTVPEAEAARKIISKKWVEKLPQVEEKWLKGAAETVGLEAAKSWWDKMVTFGRYAFNKSHSVAYSIVTFQCLYLKIHFPAEWWAAVMTECNPKKLGTYMSAAKLEGVQFGTLDVNSLTHEYSVRNGRVISGLMSIKGIGVKASQEISAVQGPFTDIDDFVARCGKKKKVLERLIKLGAFDALHRNRRGLWSYYQYKYASNNSALKKAVENYFMWEDSKIEEERERQIREYRAQYPKKKVIPKKILNWKPKIEVTRDQIIDMFDDYSPADRLGLEKELLGYYWTSPLDMFITEGHNIEEAKSRGIIEGVIDCVMEKRAQKRDFKFYVVRINDGLQMADVTVWPDIYNSTDPRIFVSGMGVKMFVDYNEERKNFKIQNGSHIIPLIRRDSTQATEFADMAQPTSGVDAGLW
jgi:DNA polymerase III subunit alpha